MATQTSTQEQGTQLSVDDLVQRNMSASQFSYKTHSGILPDKGPRLDSAQAATISSPNVQWHYCKRPTHNHQYFYRRPLCIVIPCYRLVVVIQYPVPTPGAIPALSSVSPLRTRIVLRNPGGRIWTALPDIELSIRHPPSGSPVAHRLHDKPSD